MQLEEIRISRISYGENEGLYSGSIEFKGKKGNITCKLDKKISAQFLCFSSEILIKTAQEAQNSLVEDITKCVFEAMNRVTALELKDEQNGSASDKQ